MTDTQTKKEDDFDDYVSGKYDQKDLEKLLENFRKVKFTLFVKSVLHFAENEDDLREKYSILKFSMIEQYHCLKYSKDNEFVEEKQIIKMLLDAMYELDCKCGIFIDVTEYNKKLSDKKDSKQLLKLLDEDKLKFKKILVRHIKLLQSKDKLYVLYLLQFAELIFGFNGYQAPPRDNIRQAINDSYGLNNLFEESVEEINKEHNLKL